ncbi:MAG: undecaprenyl/decaprenyl-phosphate alpha-N-acetylglucosaminyl 1-phosphate transferase [Bacteroidales bacterium]|nr:undecaprenyl/decaprenyl-phosphate alpha-N-acetylglucosaminyl 1-phosphate transferase [Bacteroidales bacterium]
MGIYDIPYIASLLITVFVFLVILNGFNLIDGIDGLASTVGIISTVAFSVWFYNAGMYHYVVLGAGLVGGLMAFLRFNVYKGTYKIFMGDTGSLIIGLVLAIMAIEFNEANLTAPFNIKMYSAPAVSFGILIVPLFDTLRVFIIRLSRKRSPFKPDKNHIHHRLLSLGFTHVNATLCMAGVNLLFISFVFSFDILGIGTIMFWVLTTATILAFVPSMVIKNKKTGYLTKTGTGLCPFATLG